MDGDEDRLLEQLEECEATIVEASDALDPVAQRRLGEALLKKGATLVKLGRGRESLAILDEVWVRYTSGEFGERASIGVTALIAKAAVLLKLGDAAAAIELTDRVQTECAAQEESDRVRRWRLQAFRLKLKALGQTSSAETASVDEEIIRVFSGTKDPEFREIVMFALVRRGLVLLREGQVEDALAISDTIVERIRDEPDDAIAATARMAVDHSRHLTKMGHSNPIGMVGLVAFALANTAGAILRSISESTPANWLSAKGARHGLTMPVAELSRSAVPQSVVVRRRRLNQAIAVDRAVIDRIGEDSNRELDSLVAKARTIAAISQIVLGHPHAGYRVINGMAAGGQLGAIQAFQSLAEDEGRDLSLANRVAELGWLGLRARALASGDKKIEQIAYEDSLKTRQHHTDARLVRWMARLIRP